MPLPCVNVEYIYKQIPPFSTRLFVHAGNLLSPGDQLASEILSFWLNYIKKKIVAENRRRRIY